MGHASNFILVLCNNVSSRYHVVHERLKVETVKKKVPHNIMLMKLKG